MDPNTQTPPPNYDFIMQAPQRPGRFSGGDRKYRIKVVALFAVGLVIIIMVLMSFLGSGGKKSSASLSDLAAYQTELSRVLAIGSTDAQSTSIRASAEIASLSISSDLIRTQTVLKQKGIKLKAKDLATYKSTSLDKQLSEAKKSNTFDATYKQLYDEKMISYQKKLNEVYAAQSDQNIRTMLKSYADHSRLLVFDYKPQ